MPQNAGIGVCEALRVTTGCAGTAGAAAINARVTVMTNICLGIETGLQRYGLPSQEGCSAVGGCLLFGLG